MWNTAFSLRNYNYTKNHAETTYELISALHVSIFETVNLTPNNQIILGTHMPFLAYISRSHYALYDETFLDDIIEGKSLALAVLKDGKLTSLHEYFKLTIYLQYYYTLSPSWRTGLHYQWAYDRYTQPQTISTLTNAFTLSFMRTF